MTDETQATPRPKREMTPRALEAHAEHMRRLAAHYMKALEEVVLSKGIDAASAIAARALGSNPEAPEQPQPFAWYWFDHLGCLYMTGNDRKPDVPGHAKPLYEHPAPPPPQAHVLAFPRELTDDLRDILSMMIWTTGPIAHALRAGGVEIKTRAEDEQAHVMHWLITLALEHGSAWREKASDRISEIRAALATTEGKP